MDKIVNKTTFKPINERLTEYEFKNLRILLVFNCMTIYVTGEDEVYVFGRNEYGCLGLGIHDLFIYAPQLNPTLSYKQLVYIDFGYGFCVGLTRDGRCYSWGNNEFGQLGTGSSNKSSLTPHRIHCLSDKMIGKICCGNGHTLALTDTGQVYAWGRNGYGQVGNESLADTFRPKRIRISEKVVSISCGKCHSVALTDTGLVYLWGGNNFGQLGRRQERDSITDKLNSYCRPHVLNLKEVKFQKAVCGAEHTVLLSTSGKVYSFGANYCGQVGNGSTADQYSPDQVNEDIKFADIIASHVCDISIGQSIDGKVYVWGFCDNRRVLRPQEVRNYSTHYKSLFDVFAKYAKFKITFKAIVVKKDVKNGLNDNKRQIDDKSLKSMDISSDDSKRQIEDKSSKSMDVSSDDSKRQIEDKSSKSMDVSSDDSKRQLEDKSSKSMYISSNSSETNESVVWKPKSKQKNVKTVYKVSTQSSNPLLKYFLESFNNPSNYEIRFRIDDQYIYGHKTLLNIRNNKFWQQFEHKLDNESKEIRIDDYSYKSFFAFIQYLYTNSLNVDTESAADLLALANAYDEEELKQNCAQLLANGINSTNVCNLYSKAITQNLKELEKFCLKYVSKNYRKVCLTQDYKDMNDSLAKQMIISSIRAKETTGTAKQDLKRTANEAKIEQKFKHKRIRYD